MSEKIPKAAASLPDTSGSVAREAWHLFGIMAEFVEATVTAQPDPPGGQHFRQRAPRAGSSLLPTG